MTGTERECPVCGVRFEAQGRRKYCSKRCKSRAAYSRRHPDAQRMGKEAVCLSCGRRFVRRGRELRCPECRARRIREQRNAAQRRYQKKRRELARAAELRAAERAAPAKERRTAGMSIAEVNALARAEGLSYGQYLAQVRLAERR